MPGERYGRGERTGDSPFESDHLPRPEPGRADLTMHSSSPDARAGTSVASVGLAPHHAHNEQRRADADGGVGHVKAGQCQLPT